MIKNKTILFTLPILIWISCIEQYKPKLDANEEGKYVVYGYLSETEYNLYPLHFVQGNNEKLAWGYSLLVEQHSLSKPAYIYHNEVKKNNYENGGLYEQQPALIKGNLMNLTNSDEEVLGYFFASSVNKKRIYIKNVDDLEITYNDMYNIIPLRLGLRSVP